MHLVISFNFSKMVKSNKNQYKCEVKGKPLHHHLPLSLFTFGSVDIIRKQGRGNQIDRRRKTSLVEKIKVRGEEWGEIKQTTPNQVIGFFDDAEMLYVLLFSQWCHYERL